MRKIGRAESFSVWIEAWLPVHNRTKISTPVIEGLEGAMVSNLIMCGKLEWDVHLLQDSCNEDDVLQILKILLSSTRTDDSWLWIDGEKEVYSIKSAYRRLYQEVYEASPFEMDFN